MTSDLRGLEVCGFYFSLFSILNRYVAIVGSNHVRVCMYKLQSAKFHIASYTYIMCTLLSSMSSLIHQLSFSLHVSSNIPQMVVWKNWWKT